MEPPPPPEEIGDSQQADIKPPVDLEFGEPVHNEEALGVALEKFEISEEKRIKLSPPLAPPKFIRPSRYFLLRGRVPSTSPRFDLIKYANKVIGSDRREQFIDSVYICKFSGEGGAVLEPEDPRDRANFGRTYHRARNGRPGKEGRPVFGLLRMVLPSGAHHIVPYLINNNPEGNTTIWLLEQYDTTFWWLYKNPDWYKTVATRMVGGAVGIRAYVEAADKITKGKRIKYRDIPDITGNSVDLQKDSSGKSAETCVFLALILLKYILDPATIGMNHAEPISLEGANQEKLNQMYADVNDARDDITKWVQGRIAGGKRRTRRRRQTRRKTKRSRK